MKTTVTNNESAGILSQRLRQLNQAHPVMIQMGTDKPVAMAELRVTDDAVILHGPAPKAGKGKSK